MIIKESDPLRVRKLELEILRKYSLPSNIAYLVEQEWKCLINGEKGEENTAYLLDFYIKNSKNWMIVHDLRIEHNGQVAQIDHLIITRFLEIYILETKAYGDTLEICNDGSFIASYPNGKKFGVESPIEQNKRHIHLLKQAIKELNLAPKRLGISLPFEFKGFVLIDAKTKLLRPEDFDATGVIKADQFMSFIYNEIEKQGIFDILKIGKIVSKKTVWKFAQALVSLHVKSNVNYKERFEITDEHLSNNKNKVCESVPIEYNVRNTKSPTRNSSYFCAHCKKTIAPNVAKFCFDQKGRFNGKAYCRTHQNNY